jgi:hypothetical protein
VLTGSREPGAGSRTIWTGDHDRSRRLAGVASQATVNAARWSHTSRLDLSTAVINAL